MKLQYTLPVIPLALAAQLQFPDVVPCQGGKITMRVVQDTVDIEGLVSFDSRLYDLGNGPKFPADTIQMKAGEECHIELVNELDTTSSIADCHYHENSYHCADTTTLHTHGLHVGPDEDDIAKYATPGDTVVWDYDVPANHLFGTHWYHAHHHGNTGLQAGGGMVGFLDVLPGDGYSNNMPDDIKRLYDNGKWLMLNHVWTGAGTRGGGFGLQSFAEISEAYNPQTVPAQPDASVNAYVVNGMYQPSTSVMAGIPQLFRIGHGVGFFIAELELDTDACTMDLIARDGVSQYTPYPEIEAIVMPQGGRADVVITCDDSLVGNTVTVSINPSSSRDGLLGTDNRMEQRVLMYIDVVSAVASAALPMARPSSQVPFPPYLDSTLGDTVSVPSNNLQQVVLGRSAVNNIEFPGFGTNSYVDELCLDSTYEIVLSASGDGTTSGHPYHQHVNHFQLVEGDGTDNGLLYRAGEWRDVLNAYGQSIRIKPLDYTGEVVAHCHIFPHEDLGMMALWLISDCGGEDGTNIGTTPTPATGGTGKSPAPATRAKPTKGGTRGKNFRVNTNLQGGGDDSSSSDDGPNFYSTVPLVRCTSNAECQEDESCKLTGAGTRRRLLFAGQEVAEGYCFREQSEDWKLTMQ